MLTNSHTEPTPSKHRAHTKLKLSPKQSPNQSSNSSQTQDCFCECRTSLTSPLFKRAFFSNFSLGRRLKKNDKRFRMSKSAAEGLKNEPRLKKHFLCSKQDGGQSCDLQIRIQRRSLAFKDRDLPEIVMSVDLAFQALNAKS